MKSSSWKIVSLLHFLMKIDKLLQLLFLLLELVSITLKKELDIAKIILWAGIILPSSRTRVTSVNWSLCLRSWISFIVLFWNASCCKQNFSITIFLYFEIETRIKFRKSFPQFVHFFAFFIILLFVLYKNKNAWWLCHFATNIIQYHVDTDLKSKSYICHDNGLNEDWWTCLQKGLGI